MVASPVALAVLLIPGRTWRTPSHRTAPDEGQSHLRVFGKPALLVPIPETGIQTIHALTP